MRTGTGGVKMPKYLVALAVGGLMECPEITYQDYQEIEADSAEEACKIYNKKNNCDYFYGTVIRKINDDGVVVGEKYEFCPRCGIRLK